MSIHPYIRFCQELRCTEEWKTNCARLPVPLQGRILGEIYRNSSTTYRSFSKLPGEMKERIAYHSDTPTVRGLQQVNREGREHTKGMRTATKITRKKVREIVRNRLRNPPWNVVNERREITIVLHPIPGTRPPLLISKDDIKTFASAVRKGALPALRHILLTDVKISSDAFKEFLTVISNKEALPSLTELHLESIAFGVGHSFGFEGMKIITGAFGTGNSSLTVLSLPSNRIHIEGLKALTTVLSNGAFPFLKELNLSNNDISKEGIQLFGDALTKRSLPRLTHLRLNGNVIGYDGIMSIVSSGNRGALQKLETLNLAFGDIGDEGMEAFEAVNGVSLTSLTFIDLAGNNINAQGMKAFATLLKNGSLPNLSEVSLDFNPANPRSKNSVETVLKERRRPR